MRLVIQRVLQAEVQVNENTVGKINKGLLVFVGAGHEDSREVADKYLKKLLGLRIFEDENGKMNLGLEDIKGELLVISQFTLYGDCIKGRRPGFVEAARPEIAKPLYEKFLDKCRSYGIKTEAGIFGADMKVELLNDGPVTLIIDTKDVASFK